MATFRDSNFENIYALFDVNFFHPKSGCVKFWTFRMSSSPCELFNNAYYACWQRPKNKHFTLFSSIVHFRHP